MTAEMLIAVYRELDKRACAIAEEMLRLKMYLKAKEEHCLLQDVKAEFLGLHETGLSIRVRYSVVNRYHRPSEKRLVMPRRPEVLTIPIKYLELPDWKQVWLGCSLRLGRDWAEAYLNDHEMEALL